MKTTLDLPEDLLHEIKLRAVNERRRIKDVVTDALRRGLTAPVSAEGGRRVALPLVITPRTPPLRDQITSDRAADILLAEESAGVTSSDGS